MTRRKKAFPAVLSFVLSSLLLLNSCGLSKEQDLGTFMPSEQERLVLYTSLDQSVYGPIAAEFEARTGIWVEVENGDIAALLDGVSGGESLDCDLVLGDGIEVFNAYGERFLPYESANADVLNPAYRGADGNWTAFSALPVVLVYNPKLVRRNPPSGWSSLLDAEWRGEIAFVGPDESSFGYTVLSTLLQILPGEPEELLPALADNLSGTLLESADDVLDRVADGTCYIGVTLESAALRGIASGLDLAIVYPEEGTCAVPDGMAVVAGCTHEENAKRFIDFALSEDAQSYLVDFCDRRSVRTDLAQRNETLPRLEPIPYDLDWSSGKRETLLRLWQDVWEART
jgi:iron(III) transport system substrate-binding protein